MVVSYVTHCRFIQNNVYVQRSVVDAVPQRWEAWAIPVVERDGRWFQIICEILSLFHDAV
jgi:hypothetical protein